MILSGYEGIPERIRAKSAMRCRPRALVVRRVRRDAGKIGNCPFCELKCVSQFFQDIIREAITSPFLLSERPENLIALTAFSEEFLFCDNDALHETNTHKSRELSRRERMGVLDGI
jgi:hypothetical protein